MHINFSPEMEQYLQSKVGSGFYNNATEVVCDAIRHMQEDDEKLGTLRTSDVQFGEESREQEEEVPHAGTTGTNHPKALNTVHKGKRILTAHTQ